MIRVFIVKKLFSESASLAILRGPGAGEEGDKGINSLILQVQAIGYRIQDVSCQFYFCVAYTSVNL